MMRGGPGHLMVAGDSEERARNTRQVIWRLIKLLSPYRSMVLIGLGLAIISAATQGLGPYLIGRAVDDVIAKGDKTGLAYTMIALIFVYIIGMFATRYQIYFMAVGAQGLLADLREQVFEKLQSLSLQYLESKAAGDLMSRLVNDIDALNSFFSQALVQMIGAVFGLIGIAVAMILLNSKLAIAVMVMVPVLFLVTSWFTGLARNAFRKTRETIGDVSADLQEELGGVKVAQAYNRTDENVRRFSARNAANRDANVSAMAVTSAFSPVIDILSTIDMAVVALLGGTWAVQGTITVGVVIAFLQYVQNFFRPLQQVAQLWTMAQSAMAAAERVFELIDMSVNVQDKADARLVQNLEGHVVFDKVSFGYDEQELVLCNVSFDIEPGKMVAIVGPTGAGKTTLVSLVPRFYDTSSGRVLIDGQDVRDLSQRSLRQKMGLVTQEPFLFSGSIMNNIRYGRLGATDEEVVSAARAANADDFISRLPQGYQTDVGERGRLLSQGQRQLIAIARAILTDPRVLIMDEATASIDTRTEVLIQRALDKLLHGRTSFVIAHRLSTVRNADQVLVIDNGELVEQGTHNELMEKGGLYADLYSRQFYQPDEQKESMISLN